MNQFMGFEDFEIGGHSQIGRRAHNEDSYLIDRKLGLMIVADGVGGHRSGEVASALTCDVLQRLVAAGSDLRTAIDEANSEILAAVQAGKGKAGMGSTVVAVLLTEYGYELAWVGDSRAYLWDGKLSLLTRDHSLVEAQVASGQISVEEARTHSLRNVILQAVGLQEEGKLDIGTNCGTLAPGSCLLLCSDGITDPMDNARLSNVLSEQTDAVETCQRLVNAALRCGGRDNATAVLIAHNGVTDSSPKSVRSPRLVWVYNPETAEYSGLPNITMHRPDNEGEAEYTQIMQKADYVRAMSPIESSPEHNISEKRTVTIRRHLWWYVLLGVIMLFVIFSLC